MTAVHYGLNSFLPFFKSKSVYWFSDNQVAVNNINYGSRKLELQSIALDTFSVCLHNNISLFPHWISRDMNETADFETAVFSNYSSKDILTNTSFSVLVI